MRLSRAFREAGLLYRRNPLVSARGLQCERQNITTAMTKVEDKIQPFSFRDRL